MYRVRLKPKAKKELDRLPGFFKEKVLKSFYNLSWSAYLGKKLGGRFKDHYVLRVWPYRIIYKVVENINLVIIERISHRQGVYKH